MIPLGMRLERWRVVAGCTALLAACIAAGCDGGDAAAPTPAPTRQPAPTLPPGAPTPLPPHPPPPASPSVTPTPAIMTFVFRNACTATPELRLRLFDQTLDLIYLDAMHDYIITSSVRSIAIACRGGNEICYGGQAVTPTPGTQASNPSSFGVGLNNDQTCNNCCFTCETTTLKQIDLRCVSP